MLNIMLKVVKQMYSKMPTKPKICIFFRFGLPTMIETAMIEERQCIVISASFRCIDVNFDWNEYCYCWGVWHIHFVKGNSDFGSPRK